MTLEVAYTRLVIQYILKTNDFITTQNRNMFIHDPFLRLSSLDVDTRLHLAVSVCPFVTFTCKLLMHYGSCPTVRDWIAVPPKPVKVYTLT